MKPKYIIRFVLNYFINESCELSVHNTTLKDFAKRLLESTNAQEQEKVYSECRKFVSDSNSDTSISKEVHGRAYFLLGICEYFALGTSESKEEAFLYFGYSSDYYGYKPSNNYLGISFDEGIAINRNLKKAIEHYKKAAEIRYPIAICNLAISYLYGVEKDYEKGMRYLNVAIKLNFAPAHLEMADIHRLGIGVEPNPIASLFNYKKAIDEGYEVAEEELNRSKLKGFLDDDNLSLEICEEPFNLNKLKKLKFPLFQYLDCPATSGSSTLPWDDLEPILKKEVENVTMPSGKAYGVIQGEVAITTYTSEYTVLASFGAASCVIISMYNSKTHTAALAHIDACSDLLQFLRLMEKSVNPDGTDLIDVHLATQSLETNTVLIELKEIICKRNRLKLVKCSKSHDMGIDSEDGTVFYRVNLDKLKLEDTNIKLEIRVLAAQISAYDNNKLRANVCYDGRDSIDKRRFSLKRV